MNSESLDLFQKRSIEQSMILYYSVLAAVMFGWFAVERETYQISVCHCPIGQ